MNSGFTRQAWRGVQLFRQRLYPILGALLVSACSTSPSANILGSYFPSWMLCATLGIIAAVLFRRLIVLAGLDGFLIAPPVVYLCFAMAITLLTWLLRFAG